MLKIYHSQNIHIADLFLLKIRDYAVFIKLRLTGLVIFSAVTGYVMGTAVIDWNKLILLILGGLFITGSSNGLNQIIERNLDKLMDRTAKRPLPDGRMTLPEGWFLAAIMGIFGFCILYFFINPICGILGAFALTAYTLAYTPLKRATPFAVLVGAFPGAIPPMLGWVAATGYIGVEAVVLFAVQFFWQFPHFWSIAWVLDDDYRKAGFKMLPSDGGRNKSSAFQILVYTISLLPVSLLPVMFKMSGIVTAVIVMITGIWFLLYAIGLYREHSMQMAKKLMLASFVYLPVIQIAMIIDKI